MDLLAKWFNSMKQYLLDADRWAHIGVATLKICIILTIGAVVVRIARAVVRNAFRMGSRSPIQISERRTVTVAKLLENIVAYVVMFIMLIAILGVFDINASGLLAGAGVVVYSRIWCSKFSERRYYRFIYFVRRSVFSWRLC